MTIFIQPVKRQRGFILVMTLWIIAIATLAASAFALWTQQTIALVQTMQENVQGEIDIQNTQATLLYLLNTKTFNMAGLTVPSLHPVETKTPVDTTQLFEDDFSLSEITHTEITLDDQVYHGLGLAKFALQDEGGLLNVGWISDASFFRFLGLLGVETDQRDPLLDKLKDFTDLDDNHRINGAESYQYQEQNLPPPPNRRLQTPSQVKQILGWRELHHLWKSGIWEQNTSIATSGYPNINTAPSLVLQSVYGLNAEAAQRVIAARIEQPLTSLELISRLTGVILPMGEEEMVYFASAYLRLTIWHEKSQRIRQIHFWFNPLIEKSMPWQVLYSVELPLFETYQQAKPKYVETPLFTTTLSTNPS
ncbi:type II secretory pathway, component PulK [Beggiatoa alba B18LD]|uniref:Type II secretory pathway, component PulK n=1 Tax=Beggiatoa alba B18LD TaxID=395493 RepID=I3CIQ4_9GAMM|nr:type II secretion system protein GspK [Beggiatoa alba]EIJ43497.1 type II secretory pathway, component PulK [Beggiatoa alba B18LD]